MALSCSSQCLRTFLGASFAHSSLGFPLARSCARFRKLSPSSSRSLHRACCASLDPCRSLYNVYRCGSICHNLTSSSVKWKPVRMSSLCSLQNSQALSSESSEPVEMPIVVESDELVKTDSHFQILRDEIETKKRELEAKIIENNALRDALRDAQEGGDGVTQDIPVPVKKEKDLEVISSQKASRNAQILGTERFCEDETPEGTNKAQEGKNVNAGSVEGLEVPKETLEEKDVETLPIASVTAQNHPWPEWRLFLEQLESDHYFDFEPTEGRKIAEDEELGEDAGRIKRAAMGFARQRNDILRALSQKNLQTFAQLGCPTIEGRTVNAGKRLRAFLQIEEALVCEPCELRTGCSRAYCVPTSHETTTTTDIIRVLVLYALVVGAYKRDLPEDMEAAARSLLSEVVTLAKTPLDPSMTLSGSTKSDRLSREKSSRNPSSAGPRSSSRLSPEDVMNKQRGLDEVNMKPGDWQCPECNYVNFQRNSECRECTTPRPLADLRPGDWQCPKCKFINFAKNRLCRECKATRVITRELREGDWICPKCKFHNFSKNLECFDCQAERPRSSGRGDDRGRGSLSKSPYPSKEERGHAVHFDIQQRQDQISSPNRYSKHEERKPDFKKKAATPSWDDIEDDVFTDDELDSDIDGNFSFDDNVLDFSNDDDYDENNSDFQPRSSSAKRGGRGVKAAKAVNRDDRDFGEWSPSPRQFPSAGRGRNSGEGDYGRSSWEARRPTQSSRSR